MSQGSSSSSPGATSKSHIPARQVYDEALGVFCGLCCAQLHMLAEHGHCPISISAGQEETLHCTVAGLQVCLLGWQLVRKGFGSASDLQQAKQTVAAATTGGTHCTDVTSQPFDQVDYTMLHVTAVA
jgi:hypothetical protein